MPKSPEVSLGLRRRATGHCASNGITTASEHLTAFLTQDDVHRLFVMSYKHHVQVFAHTNGDAAVETMIAAHQFAEKALGEVRTDRSHVNYRGDVHARNLGVTPDEIADLVILDRNPVKVDGPAIRGIMIVETIEAGRSIWMAG